MAKDMFCEPEFIMGQRKTQTHTNFACYVRGYTDRAVSLSLPLGGLAKEPKMSESAHRLLRLRNGQRLNAAMPQPIQPNSPRPHPVPSPPPATPVPPTPHAAQKPAPLMSSVSPPPKPTAIDPDAGSHTEAATKWGA
jgi:hypothetical protein